MADLSILKEAQKEMGIKPFRFSILIRINYPQQADGYQNIAMRICPERRHPECFNRGPVRLAWIPEMIRMTNFRGLGTAIRSKLRAIRPLRLNPK